MAATTIRTGRGGMRRGRSTLMTLAAWNLIHLPKLLAGAHGGASGGAAMSNARQSVAGRWRIVEMPDYTEDYPDMLDPAHITFHPDGASHFAFGCVNGHFRAAGDGATVAFDWTGNDEMEDASGDGFAELQTDGTLKGKIRFEHGDEATFIARKWTSSTAC